EWGISATGAAPALTVEWLSTANHLWWYQTFQLGGAIFYVGATSKRH
ncbi:type II secretion system protein, partial [Levilactobacillus brevis]|nr:type II secretion system protein [Levilactobacillus brevis]